MNVAFVPNTISGVTSGDISRPGLQPSAAQSRAVAAIVDALLADRDAARTAGYQTHIAKPFEVRRSCPS